MSTSARELRAHREAVLRARQERLAGVQGLAGGRIHTAAPDRTQRRSALSEKPQPMPEPLTNGGLPVGNAQLLVLAAVACPIAAGGDYVAFGAVVNRVGFGESGPGESWVHPFAGVYDLKYSQEWVTYRGGGTISLELDGTIAPEGEIVTGTAGNRVFGTLSYWAEAGSVGKIKVVSGSASAETCDALLHVAVPDPGGTVAEVTPEAWSLAFTADTWGIVHDGANWWTSEGNSGVTVAQRDSAGAALSAFEAVALGTLARDVTWDGGGLWVIGDLDGEVARYSTAGALLSSFNFYPAWADPSTQGVAWDGTDLWILGDSTDQLRRYSTAGALQQTIALEASTYRGVTVHAGDLYVLNAGSSQIVVIDPGTGTTVTTIDISDFGWAHGIWIDPATGDLYLARDGAGVYVRDTPVP